MSHHRDGIAIGRVAEKKGSTPPVRAFAKRTADGQEKELRELKQYRDRWYPGAPEMDHSQMMAMSGMAGHANMKMDMQGDIGKNQHRRKKHATNNSLSSVSESVSCWGSLRYN